MMFFSKMKIHPVHTFVQFTLLSNFDFWNFQFRCFLSRIYGVSTLHSTHNTYTETKMSSTTEAPTSAVAEAKATATPTVTNEKKQITAAPVTEAKEEKVTSANQTSSDYYFDRFLFLFHSF